MKRSVYISKTRNLLFLVLLIYCGSLFAQEKTIPVSVVTAKMGSVIEELPLTGSVRSIQSSMLSPKEEGYIESLLVDKGDKVKKGDPLMHLDHQLIDIEITRVRAQLNEAKARVKEFARQRDEAEELVKKKSIASTTYEATVAQVEINSAVVSRLEAELKRQQTIAKRHILYAPFNGVITDKMVEVGQWVDTNTPLFQLTALNPLRIEVPVPQFYYSRINIGTEVKIEYDAIPEKEFNAQVSIKVPVSQKNTRTFPVMIQIDNDQQLIAPGMSARVYFKVSEANTAQKVLIPKDAIVQKPDGSKTVWLVAATQGKNKATPIPVKTGKSYLNNIEIALGEIKQGDRIIIKGNELLQAGQNVDVIEELDYKL